MTVEFYDLAQRLYAARMGRLVLRVAAALFSLRPDAITVEARRDGDVELTQQVGVLWDNGSRLIMLPHDPYSVIDPSP